MKTFLHLLAPAALALGLALQIACAEAPVEESRISIVRDARAVERTLLDLDLGSSEARSALRSGWSFDEKGGGRNFVWGVGPISTLEVELEGDSDLVLHMAARPFEDPEAQVVRVEINGEVCESFSLREGWQTFQSSIVVPENLVRPGVNEIAFRYGRFRLAKDSEGRPLRRYAVAWDRLRISRPSRVERKDEELFLPSGETLSLAWQSAEPIRLRIDQVVADPGAVNLEVRSRSTAPGIPPVLLASLGEGLDRDVEIPAREGRAELLLTARGSQGSGFRLISPRIEGQVERITRPNVILISIDTLRADHLAVYGYDRETAPTLTAMARDAMLFEEAISQGPSTLISHASLFSLIPQHHRASYHYRRGLPEVVETLTEVLRDSGFRCGSVNGGGQLDPAFGLDQGFEVYDPQGGHFFDVVQKGAAWIDQNRSAPFFLFLHTYEVHHPYEPDPEILKAYDRDYSGPLPTEISKELLEKINRGEIELDDADRRHIVNTYDALIRSMDRGLEGLLDYLRSNDLYDSSLIVFTSDHGEEFGEHGWMGWHSHSLFDELLRVPLILKLPHSEGAGSLIEDPVRSIDVAPTILDLLGIDIPESYDGQSLLATLEGSPLPPLPSVAMIDQEDERIWSIRMDGAKWYRGMLFDLARDPAEERDLAKLDPARARLMREHLERLIARREPLEARNIEVSEETRERLRALGYL